MEGAMPFQLAIVELALEPRAIWKDLLALAFNAIVLELTFIARTICPCELALAFSDTILPVTHVGDAIRPLHLPSSVHAVCEPLSGVDPAFLCALESALPLLHAVLEVAGILVVVWPSARALAMEDTFPEASNELLTRRPRHLPFAPHHVLPPFSLVGSSSGPRLLSGAPHVALMEFTRILAAITPYVMPLSMHSIVQPSANIGISIGEDTLILYKLVGRYSSSRSDKFPWSGRQVEASVLVLHEVGYVQRVVLPIHMFVGQPHRHLARTAARPRLLSQWQPCRVKAIDHVSLANDLQLCL
mmetsp:Transcript_61104/g.113391  ORF Transcript_61104/g.113391 Transcript_61104/m.113391 type:complete len:301 (-) Transcript_61104:40-942(-)